MANLSNPGVETMSDFSFLLQNVGQRAALKFITKFSSGNDRTIEAHVLLSKPLVADRFSRSLRPCFRNLQAADCFLLCQVSQKFLCDDFHQTWWLPSPVDDVYDNDRLILPKCGFW